MGLFRCYNTQVFYFLGVSNVYETDYILEDIFKNAGHVVKALCLTGDEVCVGRGCLEWRERKKHSVVRKKY